MADLPLVLALERAADRAPHWPEAAYAEALRAGRCLFVAEQYGALCGFAAGALAGDEAELETVAVREAAQRRGAGRALVEAVVGWARQQGVLAVLLEVRAGSAGARRLYGRVGFVEEGLRPGYYSFPEEDAVVMRRSLKSAAGSGPEQA